MPIDLWLAFVAASTALLLIPGPTVLLVLSYALSQGRSVALATAAGVAVGDLVAMTSAQLFVVIKLVGAAYLVWLGIGLIRNANALTFAAKDAPALPARKIFGHAAAVTALNPKSIVFFIAFVPQFLRIDEALVPQFAVLIATFVGLAALNALAYALLADRLRRRISRPPVLRGLARLGGATLIAMGAATAALRKAA